MFAAEKHNRKACVQYKEKHSSSVKNSATDRIHISGKHLIWYDSSDSFTLPVTLVSGSSGMELLFTHRIGKDMDPFKKEM